MTTPTPPLYVALDFETTVYKGQTRTDVWAAAYAFLYSDEEGIIGNIHDFLQFLIKKRRHIIGWFHNLKFDGTFIIDYLLHNNYTWCYKQIKDMPSRSFKALISDKNRFYSITIKTPRARTIELYDSVKLLPFTLAQAAKAFKTKHQKLTMEYEGSNHYPDCPITLDEYQYTITDVRILKELMEIMLERGHNKLTIGSCCVSEFKKYFDDILWSAYFPNLLDIPYPFCAEMNCDYFIRQTYKGAWCYLHKAGDYYNGRTYDVNSLYSSQMHSSSGNYYPVGLPKFFEKEIPPFILDPDNHYIFFVHIRCRFEIKTGYLPTIQIKNSLIYDPTEWLTTSRIKFRGEYYTEIMRKGELYTAYPDLYLTNIDYQLLLDHYNVYDLTIISGCYFTGEIGIFDDYINKWMYQKEHASNPVERTEAKLFNNNLYGKLATSNNSSYQIPYLDTNSIVQYDLQTEFNKPVFSIDKGSMVTAYARNFTIRHAQKNYENFIYADTDSIHMLDPLSGEAVDIDIHPTQMGKWKLETRWRKGIFIRQKTYAELPYEKDGNKVYPRWSITCAGMPQRSKEIFLKEHPITDFKYGLTLRGKLIPRRIEGGIVLEETTFTLNK